MIHLERIDHPPERAAVVRVLHTEVLTERERAELSSLVTEYDRRRWASLKTRDESRRLAEAPR